LFQSHQNNCLSKFRRGFSGFRPAPLLWSWWRHPRGRWMLRQTPDIPLTRQQEGGSSPRSSCWTRPRYVRACPSPRRYRTGNRRRISFKTWANIYECKNYNYKNKEMKWKKEYSRQKKLNCVINVQIRIETRFNYLMLYILRALEYVNDV